MLIGERTSLFSYILRRLILLPLTLFAIILINFIIVNLAPGDPITISEVTQQGATRQADRSMAFGNDNRYLQFREFYGLTLPILFNTWPFTSEKYVDESLEMLHSHRYIKDQEEIPFKEYDELRIAFGDRSRFVMSDLLDIASNPSQKADIRRMAINFFVRGGTKQAILGVNLTPEQKKYNRKIADNNNFLSLIQATTANDNLDTQVEKLKKWYLENKEGYEFSPPTSTKIKQFFFETRFFKYMNRVLHLDFGTMRNDANKTVVSEVVKRFKYSLTLSVLPLMLTFVLCQVFGFIMAYQQNRWPDYSLSFLFLVLYAIPVFVVAPFLIEKIALTYHFPFTDIPIPINGFTSPDRIYAQQTSAERLLDVLQHIMLPVIAIIYGSLAAQSRLTRTAVLEVRHQDYIRTALAKGVPPFTIMYKHVGRNVAITIVTSLASSLGIVLGGSLIVETLFEIDGFGRFFYEAVINRDYNVIMFSAIAGSFLTLLGYLISDIAYTVLDPRVKLE